MERLTIVVEYDPKRWTPEFTAETEVIVNLRGEFSGRGRVVAVEFGDAFAKDGDE